jgi:hypothetical protein
MLARLRAMLQIRELVLAEIVGNRRIERQVFTREELNEVSRRHSDRTQPAAPSTAAIRSCRRYCCGVD